MYLYFDEQILNADFTYIDRFAPNCGVCYLKADVAKFNGDHTYFGTYQVYNCQKCGNWTGPTAFNRYVSEYYFKLYDNTTYFNVN